jgi:hypothetical protein
MGGRAKACEQYPVGLVKAILRGLKKELKEKGMWHDGEIGTVFTEEQEVDWTQFQDELQQEHITYDAITGIPIPAELVRRAKEEEIGMVRKFAVYSKVPVQQCWDRTGKRGYRSGVGDCQQGRLGESGDPRAALRAGVQVQGPGQGGRLCAHASDGSGKERA